MTKNFEVRDLNGNVILATDKESTYRYCVSIFNIIKQVADKPNYIITDGYVYDDMKEIFEKNLNKMLSREI